MNEIKVSTGRKKIAIKDEDGELVTVLTINVADADTATRFGNIIKNLNEISDRCIAESKELEKELDIYGESDIEKALRVNSIRVKYLNQIASEINGLFGENTLHDVYGDIVPDEDAMVEFVEQIIPVMSNLFGERFAMNRKRYNSNRRGARK